MWKRGLIAMNNDVENVKQAKESFDNILGKKKYTDIIKDDNQLSLLLDLVGSNKYCNILDIGTGTGYLAFPLAKKYPAANVWGIDIAEKIVGKNNEYVKEKGISNLIFKPFDGLKYPFCDETFDLIVSRYAFHHFPNAADAIRQMNKIMVKGGKVLISDPVKNEKDDGNVIDNFMKVKKDGHIHFYSLDELERLFTDNGFLKENQVITNMSFPFAPKDEYFELFNNLIDEEKQLYNITNKDRIVWVNHIAVGNTVFVKQ